MGAGRVWEGFCTEPEGESLLEEGSPRGWEYAWKTTSLSRGNATMNPWGQTGAPAACGRHLSWSLMTGASGYSASVMPGGFCDLG